MSQGGHPHPIRVVGLKLFLFSHGYKKDPLLSGTRTVTSLVMVSPTYIGVLVVGSLFPSTYDKNVDESLYGVTSRI